MHNSIHVGVKRFIAGSITAAALLVLLGAAAVAAAPEERAGGKPAVVAGVDASVIRPDVKARLEQFAPVRIEADLSGLTPEDRKVLDKLIEASRLIGEIFLRQAWAENPALKQQLAAGEDPVRKHARTYFDVMAGPWDRIDSQPFIGSLPRPDGAGFYPPDMTKQEADAWIAAHPEGADAFRGLFTIIRRDGPALGAVPYSVIYRPWLQPAADLLKQAASITTNASLKSYLEKRAAAFLNDDYYPSDVAWMDLDSRIELTIGPYETYEDRLFGYKASFESFVTMKDPKASERLAGYKNDLPGMERNLPIPDEYKNLNRGTESPIGVVDEVFTAGDTRAGVQTLAFNLPNDEKVREEKGSKTVLLRNVMDATFEAILKPIAREIIAADQLPNVTAEAFFNETLFHELSHGLGPGRIKVAGRDTEVRLELKELNSAVEEAKADVMGAWNILYMINRKQFPETFRKDLYVTFLAGMFRAVRFGVEEAHGRGVALQYNYMKEKGAILRDASTGRFSVDPAKFELALRDLVRDICVVQAHGDYEGAKSLLETYAKVPAEWKGALDRLNKIPVDIRPIYPAAGERD